MSRQYNNAVGHLLYGAKPVGDFIGVSPKQVTYLVKKKRIPHFIVGSKIASTTKLLSEWLAQQEAASKSNQD